MHETMGQSKIEVFRRILDNEADAQEANSAFELNYAASVKAGAVAPIPGATELLAALRAARIKVCLATGFSPATRDALLDALGWRPLIDLALSPADAGRGRPWPDLPLTALLRLRGGSVAELAVAGDTASDVRIRPAGRCGHRRRRADRLGEPGRAGAGRCSAHPRLDHRPAAAARPGLGRPASAAVTAGAAR